MEPGIFIERFRDAFGASVDLPISVSYTDESYGEADKKKACFMRNLEELRSGKAMSFSKESISCPGGKLYAGFARPFAGLENFVSLKERYKAAPENFLKNLENWDIQEAPAKYITFRRIDQIASWDGIEGIFIAGNADVLAGLWLWANFDNDDDDAVIANFTSGCGSIVMNMRRENRKNGRRCFIGMLDISARPALGANEAIFVIPRARLLPMLDTFERTCLSGTRAWNFVKDRIAEQKKSAG